MIHVRSRLFGQLRAFVETYLPGVATWNDVAPLDEEKAEPRDGGRRNIHGPHKEIAGIAFRGYVVTIKSPMERPPLGVIELRCDGDLIEEGPIDQATWDRLGKRIKQIEGRI